MNTITRLVFPRDSTAEQMAGAIQEVRRKQRSQLDVARRNNTPEENAAYAELAAAAAKLRAAQQSAEKRESQQEIAPACCDCRFWNQTESATEGRVAIGECRRRAPILVLAQMSELLFAETQINGVEPDRNDDDRIRALPMRVWPSTMDYDWCGEHEPD